MSGSQRTDGQALAGWEHTVQSIVDILTTPIGSRIMRREYGSHLHTLIDAPMNARSILAVYSAIATALERWEPRFELTKAAVGEASAAGRMVLFFTGLYYPRGHLGDFTASQPIENFRIAL